MVGMSSDRERGWILQAFQCALWLACDQEVDIRGQPSRTWKTSACCVFKTPADYFMAKGKKNQPVYLLIYLLGRGRQTL